MKAWAVLLPFLCISSRRLDKRSLEDAVAPPDGYLPSQDYEYDEDLRGYSATQDDLAGYSSAENELPPESEDSGDDTTTKEPQNGDFKRKNQTNKQTENEMDISTLKFQENQDLENSDTKDEEEDLISSDSDNGDDEATSKQPNNEISLDLIDLGATLFLAYKASISIWSEGSGTASESVIETGYGSPVDENGTLSVKEEAIFTDNIDTENGAPPSKTDDLTDTTGEEEDSDMMAKTVNNEDDKRNDEREMHQIRNEDKTTESPQKISEIPDDTEDHANQPNISDINSGYFPSLSSSIKICPGGSMTVCVSVCPGTTSANIYGACVQGCAERCEGQDHR